MLKQAVFILVVVALVALPVLSLPPDSVSGDWDGTFHVLTYTLPAKLTLKASGEVLTGTCDTEHTGHGTITGTVKDGKLTFTAKFEKHESIDFTGTLKDGKLEGEFRTEGNIGKWSAVPHKS